MWACTFLLHMYFTCIFHWYSCSGAGIMVLFLLSQIYQLLCFCLCLFSFFSGQLLVGFGLRREWRQPREASLFDYWTSKGLHDCWFLNRGIWTTTFSSFPKVFFIPFKLTKEKLLLCILSFGNKFKHGCLIKSFKKRLLCVHAPKKFLKDVDMHKYQAPLFPTFKNKNIIEFPSGFRLSSIPLDGYIVLQLKSRFKCLKVIKFSMWDKGLMLK